MILRSGGSAHCRTLSYTNEKRLHLSLDIDRGEPPLLAFRSKKAGRRIRADNPKWVELDAPG